MSIVRAVRFGPEMCRSLGWRNLLRFGQRVAERFEQVSDTIAEKHDLAESHGEPVRPTHVPSTR